MSTAIWSVEYQQMVKECWERESHAPLEPTPQEIERALFDGQWSPEARKWMGIDDQGNGEVG